MATVWATLLFMATIAWQHEQKTMAAPPAVKSVTNVIDAADAITDVCAAHHCHPGRVCRPLANGKSAVCHCAPADYCIQHSNNQAVCGSDRAWYPSHCELHRTACISGYHLHVVEDHEHCDVIQELEQDKLKPIHETTTAANMDDSDLSDSWPPTERTSPTARCTDDEYKKLTRNLIDYHCVRIGYSNCLNNSQEYQLAAVVMFHYYDKNSDEKLSIAEIDAVEDRQQLTCHVTDLVLLFDHDNDSTLSIEEFKVAMNMPTVSLDEGTSMFHSTAIAGSGLELKCDVRGAERLVWMRNGLVLDESTTQFTTYEDGSLYIQQVALHHAGNYSCLDPRWRDVTQIHSVSILTVPVVRVSPSTQVHAPRETATLQCYAVGRPAPSVEWQLNEMPLETVATWRYLLLDNNRTLVVHPLNYPSDTGAYKCRAQNEAGSSQDIATVFVEQLVKTEQRLISDDNSPYQVFVVFHDDGYTVYKPTRCHGYLHVAADFSLLTVAHNSRLSLTFQSWRRLCPYSQEGATKCVWGKAVNVKNKFIFVSQPQWNRLVVIDIQHNHTPVQLINTDHRPVEVSYIESLDQLVVVCWGQQLENASPRGTRTIVVIRQASEDKKHTTVHVWPTDELNIHGSVNELFLLPPSDLTQFGTMSHGYVTLFDQQKLVKLDFKSSKYTKLIDLSPYNCLPISAATVVVGGRLIVQCAATSNYDLTDSCVIIDYVTDHVISCPTEFSGVIFTSPDMKYLIVVHNTQTLMSIYSLDEYGWPPSKLHDVNVGVALSDVTYVTSLVDESSSSYNVLATAVDQDAVIYVELDTGRLSIVEGADWYVSTTNTPWSDLYRHNRYLVPSGEFGNHVMTRGISGNSIAVIDSRERRIQCNWENITHPSTAVWVQPLRL